MNRLEQIQEKANFAVVSSTDFLGTLNTVMALQTDIAALMVVVVAVKAMGEPSYVNRRGEMVCAKCEKEVVLHGHAADCKWMAVVDAIKPLLEATP